MAGFMQLCYVTNDFDRAIADLRAIHGMGPFREMRGLDLPTAEGRTVAVDIALAFLAGTQYEVVCPRGGDSRLYTGPFSGAPFELHFHHVGRHFTTVEAYRQALALARGRWPVPVAVDWMGGHYAYADARAELGHYLELFCFPDNPQAIEAPHY